MERENERRADSVIELGAVSAETKGPPVNSNIDNQGNLGLGGLTDD